MRGRHLAGQVVIPMINSRAAKAWKPEDRSLDRPTDRKGNDIKLDIIHNVQLSFCNTLSQDFFQVSRPVRVLVSHLCPVEARN